jgi:hypothetical protein
MSYNTGAQSQVMRSPALCPVILPPSPGMAVSNEPLPMHTFANLVPHPRAPPLPAGIPALHGIVACDLSERTHGVDQWWVALEDDSTVSAEQWAAGHARALHEIAAPGAHDLECERPSAHDKSKTSTAPPPMIRTSKAPALAARHELTEGKSRLKRPLKQDPPTTKSASCAPGAGSATLVSSTTSIAAAAACASSSSPPLSPSLSVFVPEAALEGGADRTPRKGEQSKREGKEAVSSPSAWRKHEQKQLQVP